MTKKTIQVRTSKGWKSYKIVQSSKLFTCYDSNGWSDKKVGEASSLEDAITLIKVDAQKYGGVTDIKM